MTTSRPTCIVGSAGPEGFQGRFDIHMAAEVLRPGFRHASTRDGYHEPGGSSL